MAGHMPESDAPSARQRDFLLLTVYVLAQQGYVERAGVLLEALHRASPPSVEVMLGRAILRFFKRDFSSALNCLEDLDRLDPLERFGQYRLTERQRMRRYMKARCLYELQQNARARDAVEVYLRHGAAEPTEEE
jgi:hypothetical protein